MDTSERRVHWENVYTTKAEDQVSWFQVSPAVSLELIDAAGVPKNAAIVDIGGGASRLVDALLQDGYSAVTVLDLSERALATLGETLGRSFELAETRPHEHLTPMGRVQRFQFSWFRRIS